MKHQKAKRQARFRIFLLLIFVILLIAQLIVSRSNQLAAADVEGTDRFWPVSTRTTNFSDTFGWDSAPADGDFFSSATFWQGDFGDPQGWNSHDQNLFTNSGEIKELQATRRIT